MLSDVNITKNLLYTILTGKEVEPGKGVVTTPYFNKLLYKCLPKDYINQSINFLYAYYCNWLWEEYGYIVQKNLWQHTTLKPEEIQFYLDEPYRIKAWFLKQCKYCLPKHKVFTTLLSNFLIKHTEMNQYDEKILTEQVTRFVFAIRDYEWQSMIKKTLPKLYDNSPKVILTNIWSNYKLHMYTKTNVKIKFKK